MTMIGIRYDLRVPPFAQTTHAELYAACLDQCAWADERGVDFVALSEHHGVEDGYLPAPLTLAAAIAGRTRRMPINGAAGTPSPPPPGRAPPGAWGASPAA